MNQEHYITIEGHAQPKTRLRTKRYIWARQKTYTHTSRRKRAWSRAGTELEKTMKPQTNSISKESNTHVTMENKTDLRKLSFSYSSIRLK